MGFWHGTCLLSRLPIRYDDPCAALIIAQKPTGKNNTYCNGLYEPVSHIIYGKYDAYGTLKDVENADWHENDLRTNLHIHVLNYNPDEPEKRLPVPENLIGLLDAIERGRARLSRMAIDRRLYLVLMHRDLAKYAINTAKNNHNPQRNNVIRTFRPSEKEEELGWLMSFMTTMRIAIAPTSGAGSQYELEDRAYARFYLEMLEKARDIHGRYI